LAAEFVHLHVHSHFSLLDGCASPAELVHEAKRLGMKAIALTDHGALHGAVQFVNSAREAGIKPLVGCEVYVAPEGLGPGERGGRESSYHLTLIAENDTGYRNLSRLSTYGFLHGFHYRPRVGREQLRECREGLIALSGCLAGEIPAKLLAGDYAGAKETAAWYAETFGKDRFYLELMDHGLREQEAVNRGLLRLHRELGLPVVATNDVHYVSRADAVTQDLLICVQTGKRLDEPGRLRIETDQLYLKPAVEMARAFGHIDGALANTLAIAERCQVVLERQGYQIPRFAEGEDAGRRLREEALRGATERFGDPLPEPVRERLEHELDIIQRMGFADYFLIVWDLVRFARSRGIAVGPGRGSAASSLVAYALRITDVDPLAHGLLFERFLNPERVTMPDIDIDFCFVRRPEVLEYAARRFGEDRVAQIGTFGTLAARAAVRDVGRVLGLPYGDVDRVAKLIPPGLSLGEAVEREPALARLMEEDPQAKALIDAGLKVEGKPRHLSVHAAGIVIAPVPLADGVPLCRTSDGTVITQYSGEDLEALGYLKMDLLGLRTLTVIDKALELIGRRPEGAPDLDGISLEDPQVYAALCRGDAGGVFQLETGMFRDLLKEVRPRGFSDLVAILALGRPGPMAHLGEYLARRRGERPVTYPHPAAEPFLAETYGIMLYQEQVMQLAMALAGYSAGEADLLRRAMGKKKPEIMEEERARFVAAAVRKGIPEEEAQAIFADVARFAEYGFAKSHSVAYALVAYKTAYLKVHYPAEFMAAQMSSVSAASERLGRYVRECQKAGLTVKGPDINESGVEFSVDGEAIRFGLAAVKHVGRAFAEAVVARRGQRPYASLDDLCRRLAGPQLNRKALESLIRAGALDSLGPRSAHLARLEQLAADGRLSRGAGDGDQVALFEDTAAAAGPESGQEELSPEERLTDELELLGTYLSIDPLEPFREIAEAYPAPVEGGSGPEPAVAGVVVAVRLAEARRGGTMAFVQIEDVHGSELEVILFPNLYRRLGALAVGKVLAAEGRVEEEGGLRLVASEARLASGRPVVVSVERREALARVRGVLREHPGESPVILRLVGPGATARLALPPRFWVAGADALRAALNKVEGVSVA